jgi:predicted transposase YbfD/YdcC
LFDLPHGTPSADTFRRVITSLDPEQFEACFRDWILDVASSFKGEVIALDGKSVRGAFEKATRKTPLHLMQVWATRQKLILGQTAVAGSPGEVDAIPRLLALFDLRGAVVTADANGATASTTVAVRKAGADFVLALKGNRGSQLNDVKARFEALSKKQLDESSSMTTDRGHGRVEIRTVHALPVENWPFAEWRDVKSVARITRERQVGDDKPSIEVSYFLSSLKADAAELGDIVRAHWGIESHLNWCLDITFREDDRAIRDEVGAQNFARLGRLALLMVRSDTTMKKSLRMKRKIAGWKDSFLLQLLVGGIKAAS